MCLCSSTQVRLSFQFLSASNVTTHDTYGDITLVECGLDRHAHYGAVAALSHYPGCVSTCSKEADARQSCEAPVMHEARRKLTLLTTKHV